MASQDQQIASGGASIATYVVAAASSSSRMDLDPPEPKALPPSYRASVPRGLRELVMDGGERSQEELARLANEMIERIWPTRRPLAMLCFVSRDFYHGIRPVLWESIELATAFDRTLLEAVEAFRRIVLPRQARFVRTVTVRADQFTVDHPGEDDMSSISFGSLLDLVTSLPNLAEFNLDTKRHPNFALADSEHFFRTLLNIPSLVTLSIDTSLPDTLASLAGQARLRSIRLLPHQREEVSLSTIATFLSHYSGSLSALNLQLYLDETDTPSFTTVNLPFLRRLVLSSSAIPILPFLSNSPVVHLRLIQPSDEDEDLDTVVAFLESRRSTLKTLEVIWLDHRRGATDGVTESLSIWCREASVEYEEPYIAWQDRGRCKW
ncbi:hypothetical protein JCM10213_003364 [Rhodosporidiobolus nylandii]